MPWPETGRACSTASARRDSASVASAESTPAARRGRWRSMVPKPPNDSGDWLALASPTCRAAAADGWAGKWL